MIEVQGLSKSFGHVQALDRVSFTVRAGEVVGFLGANGAGKTTTMDILCGCTGPDAGLATICGVDIVDEPVKAKSHLGYLPDVPPLHDDMIVTDHIRYSAQLRRVPKDKLAARVADVVEKMSLGDVRHRLVGNLSKGFRQRVAFAQAIVHDPQVLVFDEPTEGLDPNQIAQIRNLMKDLAGAHTTIIFSSHILSEVQSLCDRVIIINRGKIVRDGSISEISHELEGGLTYVLKVRDRAPTLAAQIRGMPGIKTVVPGEEANMLSIALAGDAPEAVLDQVGQAVLSGGFGLRELRLKTRSLEDVFMQLTKSESN